MKYEETPDWQSLNDIISQMSDAYAHNISAIPKYIPRWWTAASDKDKCREIDRVMTGERSPSAEMWGGVIDMMKSHGEPNYDDISELFIQFGMEVETHKSRIVESRLRGIPHDESAMDAIRKLEHRFKYIRTRKANELAKVVEEAYLGVVRGKKKPVDDDGDGGPTKEDADEICRLLDELIEDVDNNLNINPEHGRKFIGMAEKLKDPEPGMKGRFDKSIWKLENDEMERWRWVIE